MILLDNVTKTFRRDDHVVEALRGVTLRVAPGRIAGVIGASGAGKST